MSQGLSLHIGLNTIDSSKYKGNYQTLRNAENETNFYFDLAKKNNYSAIRLLGKDATSNNLLDNINTYSTRLQSGDICFN
jgi:metacaspase-1